MKSLNIVAIVLGLVLLACKKDKAEVPNESLIGTWELQHILGGQIAGAPSDFPAGNGNIIKFTEEGYQRLYEGELSREGVYKIENGAADIDGTKYSQRIVFDNDKSWDIYVKIVGNKLLLCYGSMASDGWTLTYVKK